MSCPPDCGWCCTHLEKPRAPERAAAESAFLDELATHGVYRCRDLPHTGLSLSNAEAAALRAVAEARGTRADIHPRTFLLETRRRWTVVVDWHLAHTSCPFYADHKCTVYGARPLPCRAYPVLGAAPAWTLAPECPRIEERAWERADVTRGSFFAAEARARRALDKASAGFDEAFALTARNDLRFAEGLEAADATRRARRYRVVPMEDVLRSPATS